MKEALTNFERGARSGGEADRSNRTNQTHSSPEPSSANPHDPSPAPCPDYDTRGCAALMAAVLRRMSAPKAIRFCEVPVIE